MGDERQRLADLALRLAIEAGRRFALDVTAARVLRVRSSVHVELPAADVVARVEAPGGEEIARSQVSAASALADRGAPVIRLVRPESQPVLFPDGSVTLWQRVSWVSRPSFEAVGQAIREVHDATRAPLPANLPVLDILGRIRRNLDFRSPWSGTEVLTELGRRTEELAERWPAAVRDDPLGTVLVHGDVHLENAVVTDHGVTLMDLEDAGVGPASWDFVPLTLETERYGVPLEDYRSFAAGYGAEPGGWPGLELMCRVYEMLTVTWATACSGQSPEMAAEAEVRVAGVLGGSTRRWTLM